jgi:hypothetical protein
MTYAAITGWGKCMLPAVPSYRDLSTFLDTSDEWIVTRTGIRERRISRVPVTQLAHVAAARALACAGLEAREPELIVFGCCSNEEQVPNSASGLQLRLGATRAAAMDWTNRNVAVLFGDGCAAVTRGPTEGDFGGQEIFKRAVPGMGQASLDVLEGCGYGPGADAGVRRGPHLVRWGERATPRGASELDLPPCNQSALEMVRAIMARKGGNSGKG